ncbi:MAG: hypothetical protein IJY65_05320 [Clostridia bacterium]|nr:hypothetical protein [Clostridia bacterium]
MVRFQSGCEEDGVRMYRSPSRIRSDILRVRRGIDEIYSMLNVRNLLADMLTEYAAERPERWIRALEDIISEADALLIRARTLEKTLRELKEELDEAICVTKA